MATYDSFFSSETSDHRNENDEQFAQLLTNVGDIDCSAGLTAPGPWRVEDGSISGHCCFDYSIVGQNGGQEENIAEVLGSRADAQRLAAAPALFSALHAVLLSYHKVHGAGDPAMRPALLQAWTAMETASEAPVGKSSPR